jgi:Mg2+ and Co2+ transporter CorA
MDSKVVKPLSDGKMNSILVLITVLALITFIIDVMTGFYFYKTF